MKIRTLVMALTALAIGFGSANLLADENKEQPKSPFDKNSCCSKSYVKAEACQHPCCLEAAKDNKVCKKCNAENGGKQAFDNGCCGKAYAAGKACDHPCCVKAAKASGICAKCNPKKAEKKEEAKS